MCAFCSAVVVLEVVRAEGELKLQAVDVVLGQVLLDVGEPLGAHLGVHPVEGMLAASRETPFRVVHAELPVEGVFNVGGIHRVVQTQAGEEVHALVVRAVDEDVEGVVTGVDEALDVLVGPP